MTEFTSILVPPVLVPLGIGCAFALFGYCLSLVFKGKEPNGFVVVGLSRIFFIETLPLLCVVVILSHYLSNWTAVWFVAWIFFVFFRIFVFGYKTRNVLQKRSNIPKVDDIHWT